ncbi:MAG: DnaA regulatory inactivator Hda [Legionellaceae bacterium]|nr:DnaA regulatory inactivator Hda [Legionellaceae bacterium]
MTHQLPLAIHLNDEATFADFCWNGNALLHEQLLHVLAGHGERLFYLWGNAGTGKSHVLQASCQAMSNSHQSAIYLPLKLLHEWGPQVLEGMDDHVLIAIDDIDKIATDPMWEEALFHLYNRIRDQGRSTLMITGQMPPTHTPIRLADLRSRLMWGLVLQLNELHDDDKVSTLQINAKKRGLELSISVCQYLINRCARNMHDLHALLNRLDEASLVMQRKITIPFVKEILGI